jgi:hypothetical protein
MKRHKALEWISKAYFNFIQQGWSGVVKTILSSCRQELARCRFWIGRIEFSGSI